MSNIPEPNLPPARPRRSSFATATPVATTTSSKSSQKATSEPKRTGQQGSEAASSRSPESKPTPPPTRQTPRAPAERPAPASPVSRPYSAAKRSPAFSRDILLSVADEQKARLENTVAWTAPRTGVKSQQAFIRWGIDELCSRLEQEYNDGKPFDPIPGQNSE